MFGRATITLGIGRHSSFSLFLFPAVVTTSLLLYVDSCSSEEQPSTQSVKLYLLVVREMTSELFITVVLNSVISRKFS